MGLDMYLDARVRIYKPFNEDEKAKRRHEQASEFAALIGLPKTCDNLDCIEIKREVAYWRKANQIHAWFVKECQDGVDECQTTYVPREKLVELRHLCQQVIDHSVLADGKVANGYSFKDGKEVPNLEDGKVMVNTKLAKELLPTQHGFFFGSTDYDQWYMDDLKSTVVQLDKVLALPEEVEFYYHSSW